MSTCKQCGEPAPEGQELCWCCKHTKLHPTEPKPEPENLESGQQENASDDHYEAVRHEFYEVWEAIDDLRMKEAQKTHYGRRLAKLISKRAKKWIQQFKSH